MRPVVLAAAFALLGAPALAAESCPDRSPAPEVEAAVRAYYTALLNADRPALARLTAPRYRAYDVGKRFTGDALTQAIVDVRASGTVLEWSLERFETHAACNTAWAAWVNVGSVTDTGGRKPVTWLESAMLEKRDGHWVMVFLHSTRASGPVTAD